MPQGIFLIQGLVVGLHIDREFGYSRFFADVLAGDDVVVTLSVSKPVG